MFAQCYCTSVYVTCVRSGALYYLGFSAFLSYGVSPACLHPSKLYIRNDNVQQHSCTQVTVHLRRTADAHPVDMCRARDEATLKSVMLLQSNLSVAIS